jgi:hypothetical protein
MPAQTRMRFDATTARTAASWVVACAFFAALWFPLLHAPAAFPRHELAAGLLTKAGDAFEQAFPFRVAARLQLDELRYGLFGAWPPQLLEGRDGWIFYRSEVVDDAEVLTDFLGRAQPSVSTVATWCDTLAGRRRWLAARGAASVVVVAPNKETVYADLLPDDLARKRGRTRLDALTAACGDEVVDLRAPLAQARREHPVYYRGGTHWTSQGAYVAYAAIVAALATSGRQITPIPRAAFVRRAEPNADSWLPGKYRPGVDNDDGLDPIRSYPACYHEATGCVPLLRPGWRALPISDWNAANHFRIVSEQARPYLPSAVVFHDSFAGLWLMPLLAQHFRRVVFVAGVFDQALIEAEHPDVVISEAVERYLLLVVR